MIKTSKIEFSDHPNGGYLLNAEMTVPLDRKQVFNFFADARELERITPQWLNFKILTPLPVTMKAGLLLDYKIKLHRIPIYWQTRICVWEPCSRFVDEQLKGPYKRWYHEHTFEDVAEGTLVRDRVHYIPRGGRLLHKWMVRPDLERIFRFRQDTLAEIFTDKVNESWQQGREILPTQTSGVPAGSVSEFNS
ncbi:MAG: SRPBCC family protein [Planctomycetota bacterium]